MSRASRYGFLLVATVLSTDGLVACGGQEAPPPPPEPTEAQPAPPAEANAVFASHDGSITGSADFKEGENGVEIHVSVAGAPAGTHGFHVHEVGDCAADDFTSAGGHFNPAGTPHGGPDDAESHAGDLGNIEIDDEGNGHLALTSTKISVRPGDNSVVGRAVILHADPDDLESQPTGAAGARLACGVVEAG